MVSLRQKEYDRLYREKNREVIRFKERERKRKAYADNPEKERARRRQSFNNCVLLSGKTAREYNRERSLKKKYNLTLKERDEMAAKQNYQCSICGVAEKDMGRILSVDHSHKTDKVRGLLCHSCNGALGLVKDDIGILIKMINYVEREGI